MRCEFCDEEISEGALACPRCGSPVSRPSTPTEPTAPAAPTGQPTRPSMDVLGQTAQPPSRHDPAPQAQPPATEAPAPSPDVPLAPIEQDFIAMAEEQIAPFNESGPPSTFSSEVTLQPGVPSPDVAAVADQVVPPGAHVAPERIVLDDSLTAGYRGDQAGGSVAGAGQQTADDPFGLNITETAPETMAGYEAEHRFNLSSAWNIAIMILALVVAGVVVYVGLYYGFLHKGLPRGEPVTAVYDLSAAALSGDATQVNLYAAPGSRYANGLWEIVKPYEKLGTLSIKDFDAETTRMSETSAQVQIKKFDLTLLSPSGKEVVPVLEIETPAKLPTTINLIRQNGKWLVTT